MWTWLSSLIGGPVITKLDAANTHNRRPGCQGTEAEIGAHKQASAIIIAEQGRYT